MEFIKWYLIIFSELFQSDSWKFFVFGFLISLIFGFFLRNIKKIGIGIICCLCIYVLCEIGMRLFRTMFPQLITLFVGTISLGAVCGLILSMIISLIAYLIGRLKFGKI